jgi:hypothetical protein
MSDHCRAVRPAALFADERRIEGFMNKDKVNPRDFGDADFQAYVEWKKQYDLQEKKRRSRKSYEKKVEAGTVHKKPRIADLTDPDEMIRRREANRVQTKAYREAKRPENAGKSLDEIKAEVRATQVPRVGHDKVKPGPQREEKKKPETWLQKYLAAHPDHRSVFTESSMTVGEHRAFKHWKHEWQKANNPAYLEKMRMQARRYDEKHREQRKEAAVRRREEDGDRVRATEAKYRQSDHGRLVQQAYRRSEVGRFHDRWRSFLYNASLSGTSVNITQEQAAEIQARPCFFCQEPADPDAGTFGVCLVDPIGIFEEGNVVKACAFCNRAKNVRQNADDKHGFTVEEFLGVMGNIAATLHGDESWVYVYTPRCDVSSSYSVFCERAGQRSIHVAISENEHRALTGSPCHYCRRSDGLNGIDRIDSSGVYEQRNIVPCCTQCNLIKWTWTLSELKQKVMKITANHKK